MSAATLAFSPDLPSLPALPPRCRQALRDLAELASLALGGSALAAAIWLALALPGFADPALQPRHAATAAPSAAHHRAG